jgi:hypothetical protein
MTVFLIGAAIVAETIGIRNRLEDDATVPSLRANGSGECRPMTGSAKQSISLLAERWIASSLRSSQ